MEHRTLIQEYYPHIDAGDVEWVLDLFAEALGNHAPRLRASQG